MLKSTGSIIVVIVLIIIATITTVTTLLTVHLSRKPTRSESQSASPSTSSSVVPSNDPSASTMMPTFELSVEAVFSITLAGTCTSTDEIVDALLSIIKSAVPSTLDDSGASFVIAKTESSCDSFERRQLMNTVAIGTITYIIVAQTKLGGDDLIEAVKGDLLGKDLSSGVFVDSIGLIIPSDAPSVQPSLSINPSTAPSDLPSVSSKPTTGDLFEFVISVGVSGICNSTTEIEDALLSNIKDLVPDSISDSDSSFVIAKIISNCVSSGTRQLQNTANSVTFLLFCSVRQNDSEFKQKVERVLVGIKLSSGVRVENVEGVEPSDAPSFQPSLSPSKSPKSKSSKNSPKPSSSPSALSNVPSLSLRPSTYPSSKLPSVSAQPTKATVVVPSPSEAPSSIPSLLTRPSVYPSNTPTVSATDEPTKSPKSESKKSKKPKKPKKTNSPKSPKKAKKVKKKRKPKK